MKDWAPILRLARYRLFVLVRALILTSSICLGSFGVWQYLQVKIKRIDGQLQSMQGVQAERERDLADIEANIEKFREVRRQGLVGKANREAWVEHLLTTGRRLGLPEGLTYNMKASVPLDPAANPGQPGAEAVIDENSETPIAHDLEFELRDIHEVELLNFLREYKATVRGSSRVESCRLTDAKENGLIAQCTMRFVTLPEPVVPGNAAPAGVPQ